jgi:hypothetical protein
MNSCRSYKYSFALNPPAVFRLEHSRLWVPEHGLFLRCLPEGAVVEAVCHHDSVLDTRNVGTFWNREWKYDIELRLGFS